MRLRSSSWSSDPSPDVTSRSASWVWWSALALFIVAGGTGALFRFGMVYGWTGGLALENIRHAHSHLMYFGWGTPALMVLIWACLPDAVTEPRQGAFRWVAGATLAAAFLAYPPFLLFGYTPVQMGAARLPVAVIGASLNMLAWYAFVAIYVVSTRNLERTGPIRLWDVAVGALVLASLGAWSLALIPVFGLHNPLIAKALTHVFLDLFSEGWFVLGALGLVFAVLWPERDVPSGGRLWLVILGLPFTFILGLPVERLPAEMEIAGRLGGMTVSIGLIALAVPLLRSLISSRQRWIWGIPLAALLTKAGAQFAGSLIPGLWLGTSHGLRVLYLHLMLLGFLSLVLVAAAHEFWEDVSRPATALLYASVLLLLATLVPMTPWLGGGMGAHTAAAWATLAPVLAGGGLLAHGFVTRSPVESET